MPIDRYKDLPDTTKALLEVMTPNQIAKFVEFIGVYERMSPEILNFLERIPTMPKEALDFLERAEPSTLKWLASRREKEIGMLDRCVAFIDSINTLGGVFKWGFIGLGGFFIAGLAIVHGLEWLSAFFKQHPR